MSTKSETEQLDRQIAEAIQGVAKAVGQAVVDGRKTCVHCIYFDQNSETCALAGQRPPAKVIAFGCARWEQDIPF